MKRFALITLLICSACAQKKAPEPSLTAEDKLLIREAQMKLQAAMTPYQQAQANFNAVLATVNAKIPGYEIQDNGTGLILVKKAAPPAAQAPKK